jgi:peptidoglycan/LPS O-acetylase OafA/YrhL
MDKCFSRLLDLFRFVAALLVFFHHAEQMFKDRYLSIIASFGHDAVIFFFILSGFVIGYVSTSKEKSLTEFAIARLARLYSVAVPSLILVLMLFGVGSYLYPDEYANSSNMSWYRVILSSLFFLNQTWIFSADVPTNGPYWSISYEAWYYILFGIVFYISGVWKYILTIAVLLMAGPRIILLLPIWLSGVFCYRIHHSLAERKIFGYVILFLAIFFYFWIRLAKFDNVLFLYSADLFGGEVKAGNFLAFSKRFLPDYVIAVSFILILYGVYMIREDVSWIVDGLSKYIKFASKYTFSLYLYHFPILLLLSKMYVNSSVFVLLVSLLIVFVIGYYTELQKSRLISIFTKVFQ